MFFMTTKAMRFEFTSAQKEFPMRNLLGKIVSFSLALFMLFSLGLMTASAQQQAKELAKNLDNSSTDPKAAKRDTDKNIETKPSAASVEDRLKAMEDVIERQQREIQTLREMVEKKNAANLPAQPAATLTPANAAATVATGNHYLLDCVAGGAIGLVAVAAAGTTARPQPSHVRLSAASRRGRPAQMSR